jgi:2-polyprenyl-3-methyl-5-hydroxy-6-metoxy-1,4-benzoquinol methylase
MPDLWQFIDEIDADKQAMAVKRLEDRAQIPKFAAIRENYFDKIGLPLSGRILELGCGTGAVCRAIASRTGFVGTVVGSDLSAKLIEVAKDITANLGLKNIEYFQADGQGSTAHHGQFDLVLAHTVISHVADPAAFLGEAIRLARPSGQIIVHDATMHPVHLTPIHLSSTARCLDSLFRRQTSMSCARFPTFSVIRVSKLLTRLAMSCLKSALENSSQALRKISAPLQSGMESSCKPNSIIGSKRSAARYPKARSSHHVIM